VLNEVSTSIEPIVKRLSVSTDYPDGLFITGQKAMEMINANSVLVVVDTNRGSYTECPELLVLSRHTVVLDHHRQSKDSIDTAVLSYVEPYASSACELVAEVLQYTGDDVKITPAEADAMYAGVYMDTGNFTNKTGVRTFEAAAFLRRKGADPTRVRKLFQEHIDVYRARAEAVRSAEIFQTIFAIGICPSEGLKNPTIAGAQAANELLNVIGVEASFILTAHNDSIYVSARSIDSVNVQLIMERLGGGGHGTMAGAQLHGCTLAEAKEYLKVTIHHMMEEGVI
jgi:c-di-AMP phosphodiesterase-like protein